MLSRVFEMRNEIIQFLDCQRSPLADNFKIRDSILRLAYLADIFTHLNELNLSTQGFNKNIIEARETLSAFLEKLKIWNRRVENSNFANFSSLEGIILENEKNSISPDIVMHLEKLSESFDAYFSAGDITEVQRWIIDPFFLILTP